jgi:protein TonB
MGIEKMPRTLPRFLASLVVAAALCPAAARAQGGTAAAQAAPTEPRQAGYPVDTLPAPPTLANAAEIQRVIRAHYPPLLWDADVFGRADVRVRVNADGTVDPRSIRVMNATHDAFGEAAARVARRMRFHPAERDGVPVASETMVPVEFTLPPWKR